MEQPPLDWAAVALRPLADADLPLVHAWQNQPALRDATMGFRGPIAPETAAEWLRTLRRTALQTRVVFGIDRAGHLRGLAQLHGIDWVNRSAALGISLADPADRGQGTAAMAVAILLDYAFLGLDLHRIWLHVRATNAPAIRLYERLGFTREGLLRSAFFIAGQREDVAAYALLRTDPQPPLPPKAHRLIEGPSPSPSPPGRGPG